MMTSNRAERAAAKKAIRLPQPDAENITVLTRELPNAPILPWQRYDSPWMTQGDRATSAEVIHLQKHPSGQDTHEWSDRATDGSDSDIAQTIDGAPKATDTEDDTHFSASEDEAIDAHH